MFVLIQPKKEADPSLGAFPVKVFSQKESSGRVSYGTLSNLTSSINGHSISDRPTSMSIDIKFYSSIENQLRIRNTFYTTPTNLLDDNSKTIASIDTSISVGLNSLTFTRVTIPVIYVAIEVPQYSHIRFDFKTKPTVGGEFYVIDNIVYNYGASGIEDESIITSKKVTRIFDVYGHEINVSEAVDGLFIFQYSHGSTKKMMKSKF